MKIAIYGAGAIGCMLAAKCCEAGHEVAVVARGATLVSLADQGVGLKEGGEPKFYPVRAVADLGELEEQDLIIVSVKQTSFNQIAPAISKNLGPRTKVVLAMNGVPWWFLSGMRAEGQGETLSTLDPAGNLNDLIALDRVFGCVVHLSCILLSPGVSHLRMGNRLVIGGATDQSSDDVSQLITDLTGVGLDAVLTDQIRQEIWFKLWGNMTMNPISALTRATSDVILDDALLHRFICDVMREANEIGAKIGIPIDQTPEDRNRVTRKLGAMKTSMLQDVENGNALEYEALVGAVYEMSQKLNIDSPHLSILYGLIRMLDQNSAR